MADITVIVRDGLGIGDSPSNTSKSKEVVDFVDFNESVPVDETLQSNSVSDYVEADNGSAELNNSTLSKDISDIIYSSEDNMAQDAQIYSTDDDVNLSDDIALNVNGIVSQQSYEEDEIVLTDSVLQDVIVNIDSPTTASEYLQREQISFAGTALKNGSPIANNLIRWSSSVDGIFQDGNNFDYNKLSVGEHRIRMYVNGENVDTEIALTIKRTNKANRPEDVVEV